MFKALMGGGQSSSDARSPSSSSSKSSRRKTDSKSKPSRKSSRGDDRDRGLGDLSAYPTSSSSSRRGLPSVTDDSIVSSYVTAGPDDIDTPTPIVIERSPKSKDSDRENTRSRRRDRDRSESREREKRRSRQSNSEVADDDLYRERDRSERLRTQSGGPDGPPASVPGAQFAADIAAPGFSQFPMQYDNGMPPISSAPGHDLSPSPYDPHVHQQFPGQVPTETDQPYRPPNNPAGAAADYYGDQGQSVAEQPGVRPARPLVIPNSQSHLLPASPSANPPPEPSSLGEVGAAASYFTEEAGPLQSQNELSSGTSSKPPKPSKPGKPSKPSKPSSSAIPAAAAAGAAAYGVGSGMMSHDEPQFTPAPLQHSVSSPLPAATGGSSKPPHSYGVGTGIGVAAAGAAAGYMLNHHHDHASSPSHSSQYTFQNFEQTSSPGVPPYGSGSNPAEIPGPSAGYYPLAAGGLAMQRRHRDPLTKLVDFWRDPEGVGRFEDYTETIGVCKYCFTPGTSSVDAPRKHHYHHGRRHSADRYSSGSSSRVNKLSRYHSSEDERGRRKKSRKASSWLPGVLAGYAAKSIFTGKDFDDSYNVRPDRSSGDRVPSYDGENVSYTSHGVVRRSERSSSGEYYYHQKHHRQARSQSPPRSRSSSPSGRHSFVKEAALGAAMGSTALAVAKSHQRSRSRSPSRIERRKDSSSSSSFIDVSRTVKKSAGGFASFFTAASENRKKRSRRTKSFFSFRSSSSSSLDADLAFGSGFAKNIKEKTKKGKGKKKDDVDAALLGLGATATALAASSHGRSHSTGQILTARDNRARRSDYLSSANNDDDEWEDADSEDQSSSSVSSALAFGASGEDSSSDSSSGRWGWRWGSKKKSKKDKRSSTTDAALAAGAGALGGAALASVARHRDSRGSSSAGNLQQVYPVPTSDPSRYDVVKMSSSAMSDSQTPLVRPGPIPLQQPQPVTPVSQAVYSTQGTLPGSIPAYSDPAAVPPIFANEYDRYDSRFQGSQDASWSQADNSFVERRQPRRSETSPVYPTQESYTSSLKRRSTGRDQASVSFDLTEEQAERERRLRRRDRRSRDNFVDESVQLVDREGDSTRQDSDRRQRRREDRKDDERDSEREEDSSKWVEAAAIGAIGAATVSSFTSSRKSDDKEASEASSRRRERRRAERRRVSEPDSEHPVVSTQEPGLPTDERKTPVKYTEGQEMPSSPERTRPQHDDYAEFFAPDEVRHSGSGNRPTIVEVVPASERRKKDTTNDDTCDLPTFGPEPYENHDHLPWQVPRLNIIEPTPPQSINGSVRGTSSPIAPLDEIPEEPKEGQRPSTGSRVSWGPRQTHEYEVPSSSEPEFSPAPDEWQEFPAESSNKKKSKSVTSKPDIGQDIEFAATVAAATEAAGFDPSYVIDDPKYHTRTSPPGSEDEGTFSPRSQWTTQQDQPHGFVEGEVETPELDKSANVEPVGENVVQSEPSQRPDRSAKVQETLEKLNGNQSKGSSQEDEIFSIPGGFDTGDKSRDTASPPQEEAETHRGKKKRRKRRSKYESDISANDDNDRSAVTAADDMDKSGDYDNDTKGDTNVEEYRSSRQKREEKRRQRHEDIVETGSRQESEKDAQPTDFENDSNESFLGERPEPPAAAERNQRGASGLEDFVKDAAIAVAGLELGEQISQPRLRSRSASSPAAEKTFDSAPKSQSRPSSPETSRGPNESPRNRRLSTTESPTAVPLHFRRPPTSPGAQRSAPGTGSPTAATGSPSSPGQPRHRRGNSVEFRNSREIRPLWLVERHGATKGEPAEEDETLPSLPSSKTSSRATSIEDLRTLHDEDAVQTWDAVDFGHSIAERRRPTGLTISTERADYGDGDGDLLDSQQVTPTAESFASSGGSAKKEKRKYEFHSPSELLQDPSMYPEIPSSPTIEALPSVEGSMVGVKGSAEEGDQDRGLESKHEPLSQPEMETPTQEKSFFGETSSGFAGVVDAAVKGGERPVDVGLDGLSLAVGNQQHHQQQHEVPQPVEAQADKELISEEAEQPPDPTKEQPAKEPATEEVVTSTSSKKKKKKKGKKGQASQSTDVAVSESTPSSEEPVATVEPAEKVAPAVDPGVDSVPTVEQDTTAQTDIQPEPAEASRELDVATVSAAAAESVEAVSIPRSQAHLEPESTSPPLDEAEAVEAAEVQKEAVSSTADVAAEPEQPEDFAGLSKKAKREKKKQKKKAKSAASAEVVTPPDAAAPEEPSVPVEERSLEAAQQNPEPPLGADEAAGADALARDGVSKEIDNVDDSAHPEQDIEFQEALEHAEPAEPGFVDDLKQVKEESTSLDIAPSAAQESDQPQAMPSDATGEPQTGEGLLEAAVDASPVPVPSGSSAPKEAEDADEDNFHEAVEEQPNIADGSMEVQPEPLSNVVAEPGVLAESHESKAEETWEEQPKTKGKKKKQGRKSISFDEPNTSSVPDPASELQPEQVKEVKPEQLPSVDAANTHVSLTGGETLPSESEQPTQDVSEIVAEEPRTAQEPETVTAGDAEPVTSETLTEVTEDARETPVAPTGLEPEPEPKPEPEIPMTVAQKKKAKKEKKKKAKQQSISSITDEGSPVEFQPVESQSKQGVQPVDAESSASPVTEAPVVESQASEEIQTTETQSAQSVEPSIEEKATVVDDDAANEGHADPKESPADAVAPEEKQESVPEPEQPTEGLTPRPVAEATAKEALVNDPLAEPEAPQGAPVEEPPAEPAVPMTAAQKKKAKKAKKKQQQQQPQQQEGNLNAIPDEAQAVETAPEAEAAVVSKDIEVVTETEATAAEETPTPSAEPVVSEPSADTAVPSEETAAPEEEKTGASPEIQGPGVVSAPESVAEAAPSEDAGPSKDETELALAEPDVPMTAAQKKKAKKEKKKQQKRVSMQLEDEVVPEVVPEVELDPTKPTEIEKDNEVTSETVSQPPPTEASSAPGQANISDTMIATRESFPTEAERESELETKHEDESSPADAFVEKDGPEDLPGKEVAPLSEQTADIQPVSEEAAAPGSTPVDTSSIENSPVEAQDGLPVQDAPAAQSPPNEAAADAAPVEDVEDTPAIENSSQPEHPDVEKTLKVEATPDLPPAEAEAIPEPEFQQPMTASQKKKAKKEKKKRQALVWEEETQHEPQPETSMEQATEAAPAEAEKVQTPLSSDNVETVAEPEEPLKPEEVADEPKVTEAEATPEPEPQPEPKFELPMTAAMKKKAKKDKKKRKSVTWDDEAATQKPMEDVSAPGENANSQAQSLEETAPSQEPSETPVDVDQNPEDSSSQEAVQSEAPVVEVVESKPDEASETLPDAREASQSIQSVSQETQATFVADTDQGSRDLEAPPSPGLTNVQPQSVSESLILQNEQSDEPVKTAEATEPAADIGLSAKERRQLKKKEKKKSKSVELANETSSPHTLEKSEGPKSAGPETIGDEQSQPAALADEAAAQESEVELSTATEKGVPESQSMESDGTVKQPIRDEETDAVDSVQPAEATNTTVEPRLATNEKVQTVDGDNQLSTAETAVDPKLDSSQEDEEQSPQTPEPEVEPEVGLSAKERRKLKKKEKKRQSKNLDLEENAPDNSPPATNDETAQEPTLPEPVSAEAEPGTAEKMAPETDDIASTEANTRETSKHATALSHAEDDGKEQQSHDTVPSDAPANDPTSTDEFVSSQVEQSQLEGRSSDHPQSVLERSIEFSNEKSVDVQEELDVEPVAPEVELPAVAEGDDVAKEKDQKEKDADWKNVEVHEAKQEEADMAVNLEDSPMIEEKPVQDSVEMPAESTPDADGPAQREPAIEEISQPPLSKKQKKKEKKKKQKQQQEENIEEAPNTEPEPPMAEQNVQPEEAPTEGTEIEVDEEPGRVQETNSTSATRGVGDVDNVPSAEQKASTEQPYTSSPFEEDATPTTDTAPVEVVSWSKTLSKKEKKQQHLLAKQADPGDKPEKQPTSEAAEGPSSAPEDANVSAVAEEEASKGARPAVTSGEERAADTDVPAADFSAQTLSEDVKPAESASAMEQGETATTAITEDGPTEPQHHLDELSITREDSTSLEGLPTNDEIPQTAKDNEQAEAAKNVEQLPVPVTTDPEGAMETPTEVVEPQPVSRKLSKQEKRKARKQGTQTALDVIDSAPDEAVTKEPSLAEEENEFSPATETVGADASMELAREPETITEETSQDQGMDKGPDTSDDMEVLTTPKPEQFSQENEVEQSQVDNKESEAVVSLDPFDVPSPAEGKTGDSLTEHLQISTEDDAPRYLDSVQRVEQKSEANAKIQAQALEKEADLEVAAELFEDRPREPEVISTPSRKLSKKEKRKAKKKGIVEESVSEQEQQAISMPISTEPREVEESKPALGELDPEPSTRTETEVQIQPGALEAPLEVSDEIDPAKETQPATEPETITEPEPAVPQPVTEQSEPEPELSRKASKKKAKKAKKAARAWELEPSPEPPTDQGIDLTPVKDTSMEGRDVDASPVPQQDEDEWPTIEWEQNQSDKVEPPQDLNSASEPNVAAPEAEIIGDFDESAVPEALREVKKEPEEPVDDESWSVPMSKKDKKKSKKNKRKSEQAPLAEAESAEPSHKKIELASAPQSEPALEPTAPKEIEVEPLVRTTTTGSSKIATLFPGLERGGFRRSALNKDSPSLKDSAEEETVADQEATRNLADPISEAPLSTSETKDDATSSSQLPAAYEEVVSTTTEKAMMVEGTSPKDDSIEELERPKHSERSIAESFPSPTHPASKERSSILFGSSPSTRTEEPSTPRHHLPSQIETTAESPSELHRTSSVIHGRHQQTARTWSLDEPSLQALQTPSPSQSLFGGAYDEGTASRPRTPLGTITEQEPGDGDGHFDTPRLNVKPEHVLPRPVTPVRKFTDNSLTRESWPTGNDGNQSQKSPVLHEQSPVLKPSSSSKGLRRTNRSTSGDLRAARHTDSQPPPAPPPQPKSDLDQLPSSSSYDPVTDKGKQPLRNMSDVYEGWGETPSSPRSPSRPPSVRHRRSIQHLQDLEVRLDQLISENRLLIAARDEAEDRLRNASVARRKSDQALNTRGADLRDKEAEVEQLKSSVEWLQKEMSRLTHENEGLTASNAALAAAHAAEVTQVRETSTRELNDLRSQHVELSTNLDDRVRQEIESALAQKDTELRRLREELEDARDKVKELQQQIAASVHDNALVFRDEDYFDAACQKLCGHIQQWVLRFSKHSDNRRCRALSDLRDEKIVDRFDNALLDGSDADAFLSDRVRRRDIFMSVVMTMIWEYIFTRYLFGMDREQRQKLKSLEKQLGEVGPQRAVHRWRATTLTLLSRRPAFASQRQSDTEAVALEIFGTLSHVLPPPSQVESQLLDSLRKVLHVAVNLSLEMRTQLAEFIMLPPLQPEYDTNGDLARQVYFNASLMNERSGETSSNEELEAQHAVVRIVLFPLVVKKGNDVGEGDDEVVVCPAQVLVARLDNPKKTGDRMSIDAARSVHSVAPSIAPSTMDMGNMI